jgi:hypothetical protein
MPWRSDRIHLVDVLAIPIFAVAIAHLWSKSDRTPMESVFLVLAVLGLVLDIGFTAIHIKKKMVEIKLKRTPAPAQAAK